MSLKEYVRKRKFTETPEPAPDTPDPAPTQGRFFIQRHDATRLHYDLRLEISGTLKSWAVPKGPSLVPLSKNLAMHVEDHPLSYGDFEGNIPKGNYGAGSVMLWDRGTFELLGERPAEEQLEKGDLKFRLNGEKLKGEFALIRMKGRGKGNEWLCIKKRDEFADPEWDIENYAWSVKTGRTQEEIASDLPAKKRVARKNAGKKRTGQKSDEGFATRSLPGAKQGPMPQSLTPMMAFAETQPPAGNEWLYEVKWDGVRAICFIENGAVRIISRNGNSFDRQYPELSVLPHYIQAATAIVDGEIAVLDEEGKPRFELIQPRIHQTDPNTIAHLARKTPVKLFLFDLIYLDGYDLRAVPLLERKRALRSIVQPFERLQLSDHFVAKGPEMLEAARTAGLEGIIAKRCDSKYEERRSRSWLKIKVTGRQEFVICGYTHGERDTFSSLVLGVYDAGRLVWAGNVGTGFNEASLEMLAGKLAGLRTAKSPFDQKAAMLRTATWVEPRLVCECKFVEWTREGRLRAPVFLGLRPDKNPEDCVREPARVEAGSDTADAASKNGPLFPETAKDLTLTVDGRTIKFTNLGKTYYPREGYTKRDLLNYYDQVSGYLLPHLKDRPLSLKRYPNGIHEEFFFQKNIPEEYPDWLRIEPIHSEHRGEEIRFVVANDRATLLYLTNLGCIDQNPWMSRVGSLEYPDYILIDLDPQECSFDMIIDAALLVKNKLDLVGLQGYPKTTGGDGMHVFVPIEPRYTYDQVRSFAEILSRLVIGDQPDLFTTPRAVSKRRKGRVYFDYLQISSGKTIAAPYVLRAYDGAPVAAPLSWQEVQRGLRPEHFHIGNALARFHRVGDLFAPVLSTKQRLEPALKRLSKLLSE